MTFRGLARTIISFTVATGIATAGAVMVSADVNQQLNYALTWWNAKNPAYGYLPDADCMNFASQTLVARGWKMDSEWYMNRTGTADNQYQAGRAWVSSTAFWNYLHVRPKLATELTNSQRDQVKLGDIVQFDWSKGLRAGAGALEAAGMEHVDSLPQGDSLGSVNRDHTGVVTRVERTESGQVKIYFAGHTNNRDYMDVDKGIDDGNVYFWHIQTD